MPAIWNVSNNYNVNNNKKVQSKLTFEVGERFSGKIVGKGEGKEVTVKLADGWQFNAEMEGDLDLLDKGPVKFEVEGYENGKLKLKLVAGDSKPNKGDNLANLINKEGLTKNDELILKEMIKFNIPLTKENINEIKGLIQFNEKINSSEEEITKFIKNFLQGKNIDINSARGKEISEMLKDFFKEYKTLDEKDILLFKENNIEFTEETIKSYNKLFKGGDETIKDFFKDLKTQLTSEGKDVKENGVEGKVISSENKEVNIKDKQIGGIIKEIKPEQVDDGEKNIKLEQSNKNINAKAYEGKEKVSMLEVLKTIAKDEVVSLKNEIINVFNSKGTSFTKEEVLQFTNMFKELSNDEIGMKFKELFSSGNKVTKEQFEKVLGQLIGKEVVLTEKEYQQLKGVVSTQLEKMPVENLQVINAKEEVNGEILKKVISEGGDKIQNTSKEIVKENIKENLNGIKDTIREMIAQSKLEGDAGEKIFNLLKNNLNSFKLMNSINNGYYYLDMPVKREEQEYPCKLIIKDNRKDGKKIDKNNVKMVVSIKTINLGTIDGYLTFKGNILDVELKCLKEVKRGIGLSKEKLENNLKELGFNVNIRVTEKLEGVSLTNCREFFGDKHKSMLDKRV